MKKVNLQLFGLTKEQIAERAAKAEADKLNDATGSTNMEGSQPTVEELMAVIEQMKADALADKEAAAERLSEIANAVIVAPEGESITTPEEFLNQRVQIQLFKDNDKYKDDVVIGVNGEKIQIKRGIAVMIPRSYALILESTYRQQMVSADLQSELANEFKSNAKAMGVE